MNGDNSKQKKKVISKGPIKKTQKVVVVEDD